MSEPIKLPPLPDTEYTLAVPSAPYEPAWISSMEAWDQGAIESYARLAVERATAELRAEVDALKRRLGQHDACNGVMGESGYVPECISLRAEVERLRAALDEIAISTHDDTAERVARAALKEPK
jgi:hypothetical protein